MSREPVQLLEDWGNMVGECLSVWRSLRRRSMMTVDEAVDPDGGIFFKEIKSKPSKQ